jgi:hypothetical protein
MERTWLSPAYFPIDYFHKHRTNTQGPSTSREIEKGGSLFDREAILDEIWFVVCQFQII